MRTAAGDGHGIEAHALVAQSGQNRVVFAGGQHRDGVEPGQGQRAGHVDALAAGLGGHRLHPVYGAAHQLTRAG